MLKIRTLFIGAAMIAVAIPAAAQGVPGQDQILPSDINARSIAHITSGQRLNAQARSATVTGRYIPGRNIDPAGPKRLASDMTFPNALPAQSGAKLARLRSYAGPQGNTTRRPTEVCNSDVNIGSIVSEGDLRISGPVRQEVYTGDVTVLNLNRCRPLNRRAAE